MPSYDSRHLGERNHRNSHCGDCCDGFFHAVIVLILYRQQYISACLSTAVPRDIPCNGVLRSCRRSASGNRRCFHLLLRNRIHMTGWCCLPPLSALYVYLRRKSGRYAKRRSLSKSGLPFCCESEKLLPRVFRQYRNYRIKQLFKFKKELEPARARHF